MTPYAEPESETVHPFWVYEQIFLDNADEWRRGIIKTLVYVAKYAPPAAVGIDAMTWTKQDLDEWAEATSELMETHYHVDDE